MIEVQLRSSDDLIFAETGQRVDAGKTVYIATSTDPRNMVIRELDLTEENAERFWKETGIWTAAGHAPGEMGPPAGIRERRDSNDPVTRQYNEAMRAWADRTGFQPSYQHQAKGGYYYPVKLRKAFAAYLAGQAAAAGAPGALPGMEPGDPAAPLLPQDTR